MALTAALFIFLISTSVYSADDLIAASNLRRNSTTDSLCANLIEPFGFPCSEHIILTEDGYILGLQRVSSPSGAVQQSGSPVLLIHGLFMAGDAWFLDSPNQSLGFILASSGYDVWVGNVRGTRWSHGHVSLSESDKEFWDWSWQQLSEYDLIGMIQYINSATNSKVFVVGHSQGTIISLAAFTGPNITNMVEAAALLSPISYLNHITSSLVLGLVKFHMDQVIMAMGIHKVNFRSGVVNSMVDVVCEGHLPCGDFLTSLTGKNCCFNNSRVNTYLDYEPHPTSSKNLHHLFQMIRTGTFAKYDYGTQQNLENYGQRKPPSFDISSIPSSLPIWMAYGGRDALADVVDVLRTVKELPSKPDILFLEDYGHLDFLLSETSKQDLFDSLLAFFSSHRKSYCHTLPIVSTGSFEKISSRPASSERQNSDGILGGGDCCVRGAAHFAQINRRFFGRRLRRRSEPPAKIAYSRSLCYRHRAFWIPLLRAHYPNRRWIHVGASTRFLPFCNLAAKGPSSFADSWTFYGDAWFLDSPNQSLGFILADRGFDVWVGNVRGTHWSHGHVSLSEKDKEFWDWSWQELALYDLGEMIRYVHSVTNSKVFVVGHSQGTIISLAAFTQPNIAKMVEAAALLCPISYLEHVTSRFVLRLVKMHLDEIILAMGIHELNFKSNMGTSIMDMMCDGHLDCDDLLSSITGKSCCFNSSRIESYLEYEPHPSSSKNLHHLFQMIRKGTFAMYDYGMWKNLKYYSQVKPPIFDLSSIPSSLPIWMGYGGNDALADVLDVQHTIRELPSKPDLLYLENYGHIDFLLSVRSKEDVYDSMLAFFSSLGKSSSV